jgi:hypothetical protein
MQPLQALDYRLSLLKAAQQLEWRLRQERTDAERRRQLTDAALEALKAVQPSSAP